MGTLKHIMTKVSMVVNILSFNTDWRSSNSLIDLNSLLRLIAKYLDYDFVETIPEDIDVTILESVTPDVARMYRILPIAKDATSITFLAKDPFNFSVIDDLSFSLKKTINIQISNPDEIEQKIIEFYGSETYSLNHILTEIDQDIVDEDYNKLFPERQKLSADLFLITC